MIFYFSTTGNSLYAAKQLAGEGEQLVFIPEAAERGNFVYEIGAGGKRGDYLAHL